MVLIKGQAHHVTRAVAVFLYKLSKHPPGLERLASASRQCGAGALKERTSSGPGADVGARQEAPGARMEHAMADLPTGIEEYHVLVRPLASFAEAEDACWTRESGLLEIDVNFASLGLHLRLGMGELRDGDQGWDGNGRKCQPAVSSCFLWYSKNSRLPLRLKNML